MGNIKKCFPLPLVLLFFFSLCLYAAIDPPYSDAFKNANIIDIEVLVDMPEKLLISSKEGFTTLLKNSIFVELKSKLPSSIKV